MDKPVEAIERMRRWTNGEAWGYGGTSPAEDEKTILAYLDSVPEWPEDFGADTLQRIVQGLLTVTDNEANDVCAARVALRALAAIAPVRKKRVVNLWQKGAEQTFADVECDGIFVKAGWQKMNRAGPIELED